MRLDAILTNATIWTGEPSRREPPSRIGIWQGRIVGLDDELDGLTASRVIDLDGAAVLPGFHDAHCHTTSFGLNLELLDLRHAVGVDDILRAVAERAAALSDGEWVIGVGYAAGLAAGEHPDARALDRAAAGRPVWLTHASGHMCVVSSSALAMIRAAHPAHGDLPANFGRDGRGADSGLLEEFDMDIVKDFHGPASIEHLVEVIDRATRSYAADGITSFTEAGIGCPGIDHSPLEIAAYQVAREHGRLFARAQLMVYSELLHELPRHNDDPVRRGIDLGVHTGLGDGWVSIGAVKIWLDGSGIANTAASTSKDDSGHGDLVGEPEALREMIIDAHASGWQVAVHAMGDTAVDVFLDALERCSEQPQLGSRAPRHRIEHGGLIRDDQVSRIARQGVAVVIQPSFIAEFGDRLRDTLLGGGARAAESFRAASLLSAGIALAGSSDRPVSTNSPLQGVQAMVERLTESGWAYGPAERLGVDAALSAYTYGGAYAARVEQFRGTLTGGRDADLVVLTDDPTKVQPECIGKVGVVATVVGGHPTYDPDGLFAESPARSPSW
jgi:predicted amidohydrolase YtcJ